MKTDGEPETQDKQTPDYLESINKIPEPYRSAALNGDVEFFTDLEYPVLERQLHQKFRLKDIEWVIVNAFDFQTRDGYGIKVFAQPYIKKESAERRADIVFGAMNWRNDYNMPDGQGRFKYKIEIRKDAADLIDGEQSEWIPKIEGGSIDQNARGGFSEKNFEIALSFAEKRAWAKVGIGRYLKLVPQIECRVSEEWVEGWNRYSFKSKVEGNQNNPIYRKIYWEEPQLPEWALHDEDSYNEKMDDKTAPQNPEKKMPANDAQWELMIAYYDNMPEDTKEQWHNYMFVDDVDDETGEVVGTRRRPLNAASANKIITSLEKGYGQLNEDNIPEAFAGDAAPEPVANETERDVKQMREQANKKKP